MSAGSFYLPRKKEAMDSVRIYRCRWSLTSSARLLVFLSAFLRAAGSEQGAKKEFCQNEDFIAKCQSDEVIVMQSAEYGRMHEGRCVKKNYGFIGCGTSVLGVTDFLCSGRHMCSVRVPNEMFDTTSKCPEDFKNFLEASYVCVKVTGATRRECQNTKYIPLTAPEGVLGSVVTTETGCGSPQAPWLIQAKPGQRINVTLIDFYYGVRGDLAHLFNKEPGDASKCYAYAIFKEAEITRSVTLCGGRERQISAYMSTTHTLQVVVFGGNNADAVRYFLLNYTVLGCPTPSPPDNGWLSQTADDTLEWGCNDSSKKYTRTCTGNTWSGDTEVYCPAIEGLTGKSTSNKFSLNLTYEMAIAMIVSIALVIACFILCVGIIWLKRSRDEKRSRNLQNQAPGRYDAQQQYMAQTIDYGRKEPENLWAHYDQYRNGENIYASIQEAPTIQLTGRKSPMVSTEPAPCPAHESYPREPQSYPREPQSYPREPQSGASTPYSTLDNESFHTFHFPSPKGAKPNAYSDTSSDHYRETSRQYFTVDPGVGEADLSIK